MIDKRQLARAEHIIDSSGVVDVLIAGYRTSPRGRPANRSGLRLMLLGMLLSIHHRGTSTLTSAHATLSSLDVDEQIRIGWCEIVDGKPEQPVTLDDFYNLDRVICERLAYTEASDPELDDSERERRHQVIRDYCDALCDVFRFAWDSDALALDATGVWSWGRGYSKDKDGPTVQRLASEHHVADESVAETIETMSQMATRRRDVDAAWGVKTKKNGQNEVFFGYEMHAFAQTPQLTDPRASDETNGAPPLLTRFELTPAGTDVVDVSLNLLDRHHVDIKDLIVDRHYHYKTPDRWKAKLDRRGVRQHLNLRKDEHGFTEYQRMRFAAGSAHCPATPDDLGTIERPNAGETSGFEEFSRKIAVRERYAMQPHTKPDEHGTHRVKCPAVAGKVGCPLRPDTEAVAIELGLPLVENPPSHEPGGEPLPACCTQETVTVSFDPNDDAQARLYKLQQQHYWGSEAWERVWSKRTYIEGLFGNVKNPGTENLRRGHFQIFGLVWVHIVLGLAAASYNLRMLDNWAARNPGHPHQNLPLTASHEADDEPIVGRIEVTAEEYKMLQAYRAA